MNRSLSTTAYAVLGLIALRPLTAYELTQQMQRSLDYCWPTSERSLYDQPDRLLSAGLATAVDDDSGRRRYAITEAGRSALRAWLHADTAMPRFQNEPLLRVLLSDQGSVADLHRVLDAIRKHTDERRRLGIVQLRPYLAGDGLYQDRAHVVTIVGDLIARILRAIDDWADDVATLTAGWETTAGLGLTSELRSVLEDLLSEEERRITERERWSGLPLP